jgi:hypothetical protein
MRWPREINPLLPRIKTRPLTHNNFNNNNNNNNNNSIFIYLCANLRAPEAIIIISGG